MSVTFVHASSESGDDYYWAFDGKLTDDEIESHIADICGDEAEYIGIEYVLHWPQEAGEL